MTDALKARLEASLGGAYALDQELVGGGMSRVFAGTETAFGRRVVVKVLPPEVAARDPLVRFRQEAVLAARLDHPHIVPVFAMGEVEGIRYYTMPFIDGESIRARLDRTGALSPAAATRVLCEIASALACAHRHGIVHRDVKPENIFIDNGTGRALLADFGVASVLDSAERVTQAGMTVGTPAYMSPEQVDGRAVDERSDIYSLGLVGWEMLSGVRPWPGETMYTVMHKQQYEVLPPIDTYRLDVPPSLAAAIDRALCKERSERWPSAEAFLMALAEARGDASLVTSRTPHWDEEFGELGPLAEPRSSTAEANAPTLAVPARGPVGRLENAPGEDGPVEAAVDGADWADELPLGKPQTATAPMAAEPRAPEWVWDWQTEAVRARNRSRRAPLAIVATLAAFAVFGAVRLGRGLVPRSLETHGEVAAVSAPTVDPTSLAIDAVSASAAATRLRGLSPATPRINTAISRLHAPPAVRIRAHHVGPRPAKPRATPHRRHRPPKRRHGRSAAVHGHVATARLAVEAYEAVVGGKGGKQ